MNVVFIGKHKYPKDIFSNELDMKTWRGMAVYFDRLFVIAESPDLFFHKAGEKNISIYIMSRLGYLGFIIQAVCLGLYLNLRYGIDIFDASEIVGGGIAVTILKFFTNRPTVIEIQGEIFKKRGIKREIKNRFIKRIGRFVIKRATRIRVISRAIFSQVKEQGISEDKIRPVSLRVDLTLFDPNRFAKSIRQTRYFGDKLGITIGYVGRLIDGKGLEDLLKAIQILKNHNSELGTWNLVIYGSGPLEQRLKKITQELGISDLIEWCGFVPYSQVPEALSQIDIFVYPSWHEGFGRSIMEALAMERAVVATNIGGIPDLINDGENGFLVGSHNPEKLADKILVLIKNKNLRGKFGKAGREYVSKNYEWNDGIKKFVDLFLELK